MGYTSQLRSKNFASASCFGSGSFSFSLSGFGASSGFGTFGAATFFLGAHVLVRTKALNAWGLAIPYSAGHAKVTPPSMSNTPKLGMIQLSCNKSNPKFGDVVFFFFSASFRVCMQSRPSCSQCLTCTCTWKASSTSLAALAAASSCTAQLMFVCGYGCGYGWKCGRVCVCVCGRLQARAGGRGGWGGRGGRARGWGGECVLPWFLHPSSPGLLLLLLFCFSFLLCCSFSCYLLNSSGMWCKHVSKNLTSTSSSELCTLAGACCFSALLAAKLLHNQHRNGVKKDNASPELLRLPLCAASASFCFLNVPAQTWTLYCFTPALIAQLPHPMSTIFRLASVKCQASALQRIPLPARVDSTAAAKQPKNSELPLATHALAPCPAS